MLYSAKTNGFYSLEIHGKGVPLDAVEISDEQYFELLAGQSSGKRIVSSEDGQPTLVDRAPPTKAELLEAKQAEARAYLAATDWYVTRKVETGADVPADVAARRAEARAILN